MGMENIVMLLQFTESPFELSLLLNGEKANILKINIVCNDRRVYIEKEVNQSSLCTSKLFQINLLRHNLQKKKGKVPYTRSFYSG